MVSNFQIERKRRSEAILLKEDVPFIDHLPVVESEEDIQLRSLEQVAWRAMALNVVAARAEGLGRARFLSIVEQYDLKSAFTPDEQQFVFDDEPSEHARIQFVWRYEAYWTLLWALSYIDELGRPAHNCNVELAVQLLVDRSPAQFIKESTLRTANEILDATDLIYRYHWACVDARLNGRTAPAGLDEGVVMERHHALNWLTGYMDNEDWDDVSTDT